MSFLKDIIDKQRLKKCLELLKSHVATSVNGQKPDKNGAVNIGIGVESVDGITPDEAGNVKIPVASDEEVAAGETNEKYMTPANTLFAINKRTANYYNSVETMKADRKLKAGMTACTLGYYSPNDGGGGTYIIRAKADGDVDDGGSLHELVSGLVAELVVENGTINVKQFGAKGDGVTDDSVIFQKCIDFICNNNFPLYVSIGKYIINTPIQLKADNATFKIYGERSIYPYNNMHPTYGSVIVTNNCSFLSGLDFYNDNNYNMIHCNVDISYLKIETDSSYANNKNFAFDLIEFNHSEIHHLVTHCLCFLRGSITGVTHVHNNYIMATLVAFSSAPNKRTFAQESWITHNYINGRSLPNSILFDMEYSNWLYFENNYCDYFGYLFGDTDNNNVITLRIHSFNNIYDTFICMTKSTVITYLYFTSINDTFGLPTVNEANTRYGINLLEVYAISFNYKTQYFSFIAPEIMYGTNDEATDGTIYFVKGAVYAITTLGNRLLFPAHSRNNPSLPQQYTEFVNITLTGTCKDQRAFIYENGIEVYDELPNVKNESYLQTIPNGYKCMVNGITYIVSEGAFVKI